MNIIGQGIAGGTRHRITNWVNIPISGGNVDATPVFAAVFTATATDGTVTYELPPGTFSIDPQDLLALPAGSTLQGAGMGVTILQMEAGRTGNCLRGGSHTTLRDLTIAGNDESSTVGFKPSTNAVNVKLERVEIKDTEIGVQLDAAHDHFALISCRIRSNTGFGLQTNGASSGLVILNCDFESNGTQDIALQGSPTGGLIAGNRFTGTASGIVGTSPSRFAIVGNYFNGVTTPFSASSGSGNMLAGNNGISDPNATVSGTRNSIEGRYYATSTPSSGTWLQGDLVWNRNPGSGTNAVLGWLCSTAGSPGTWQPFYRGMPHLIGTFTWDPASMADGAVTSKSDFNVPGAALGNRVTVAASYAIDAGVLAYASVVSADTVRVTLFNHSGSPVDLGSGTWTLQVNQ